MKNVKVELNPQTTLKRIRRPVQTQFVDLAHETILRMFQGPNSRIWKYPGLMHRYATPDVHTYLTSFEEAHTFFVSRKWSRCCLVLFTLRDKTVSAIFHKENNRLEIVNTDGRLPQNAFQGTVVDGFLDVAEGAAVFYPIDPIRYAGRWLSSSMNMVQRRGFLCDLYSSGTADTLAIRNLDMFPGLVLSRDADKLGLVYTRGPKGTYRAHMVCYTEPAEPQDGNCSYTGYCSDDHES